VHSFGCGSAFFVYVASATQSHALQSLVGLMGTTIRQLSSQCFCNHVVDPKSTT